MFEAHVLHLLRRYLGEYIHGLSSEALRISVWKGDVVLKDLKLKAEALNSLKLPVTVKAGFVGIITLKVPWKSLGKEPVIVLIDRVFVLVHPAPDTRTFNVQQDRDKLLEAKLQWIEAAEAATVEAITKVKTKSASSQNSWFGSLIATTIGNLKISITNVHIRYEDSVSHLGNPFAGGVTLAKLAAVTMDDFENETFVTSGVLDKLRKSLQLERLAMYHDCNSDSWKVDKKWEDLSRNEWIEMFEDGITENTSTSIKSALNRNYLISPINGVLKYHRLGNQERNDPDVPFEKTCLTLDDVYFTITESQYHDLIKLLEVVSRYRTCVEISHLRPTVPVSEKPFLWWRFAVQAALHKRKICYRFSWDQIKHLCKLRRHYVDVYASSLQQMACVNMSDLRIIEIELDPKVILLWRLLAHAKVEFLKSREALEKKRLAKRSWFSFRWRDTADYVSESENVEGSKAMEGGLTKEEWQEINKLLSYQPHDDFAGKEMQQMMQFLVDISVRNAAARIINVDGTEILCGRFEQLYLSTMFKHGSTRCDVLLKFYGLSTPEGSVVQSVCSEQNVNALGASFVRSPTGENLDWKLSATILPCHVTVIVESFDRVMDFMKRSNAVSPTVALETATALQMKIEKVARRAQEQFQMVIEEKSRFCIDIDFDAPKVRVPIRISSTCESHFHLDFGHFTLHTKECPSDEEWKNIYSRFYIQGRDIAAFLTDCGSDCQDCTLLNPNYITSNSKYPSSTDIDRFYSLIDRCRMVVVWDRIKIPHPVYPSTRVSIQVPNLRIHFSPERYLRIMQLLNILYRTPGNDAAYMEEDFHNEVDLWNRSDISSAARILVWGGIGKATASWSPSFLTLSGLYLYIFDSEKSKTYQRCLSMVGKHISEIPPSNIGGSQFCIAIYTRGIDIVKALESSGTLTVEFSNEEEKSLWIKALIQTTYQASVSPEVDLLGISNEKNSVSSETEANYLKSADLAIRGTLAEATIILYGNGDRVLAKSDEMPILEVLANGGVVHVIQLDTDLTVKMKLHSLKILDQLFGFTSEPQYLAISVLADNSCISPSGDYNHGNTHLSLLMEENDIFKDALSDFTYFSSPFTPSQCAEIFHCNNFGIDKDMSPASRSEFGTGNSTPGETFYEAQGVDTSDFVSLMFSTKSSWSLDYMGIDTEMIIRMSKLHFFCSRPIIVALIDFGFEISSLNSVLGNIQNPISHEHSRSTEKMVDNAFVKGLLGSGKARVVFLLQMDIDNVTIFLNKEDGTQLAMFEQESFLLNIKVHPSCISVEGTLGNLRLFDLSLRTDPCWRLLCDIRNPGAQSLIMFKFESYSRDDEDYEGYDYSLYGRLSSVHIIFLNRFVQEIMAYFTGLATPHAEEAIKLVDKVGNMERWIQKYEIDGASSLKFDLSLETPLIIVPKNSMSKDFIQLDLGHLKVTNEFYWHGSPDIDPSSVHIDVLHAEILGINLAIGISGIISKPLIREGKGFDIYVRRSLRDVFRKIPTISLEVKVGLLHAQMSDKEYSIIVDCVYMNLTEEPRIPVNLNVTASGSKETLKRLIDRVNINSQTFFSDTVTVIAVEVDCALLELYNGVHGESPLAQLALEGLWLSYRMTSLSESDLYLTIPKFSVLDIRSDTKPEMRLMLGSSMDAAKPCAGLNIASHFDRDEHEFRNNITAHSIEIPNLTMFLMDYRYRISSKSFVVRLQHPRVLVVPDFILAVGEFFVPSLGKITGREETADPSNDPISKNNRIVLSTPFYEQNEDFVILSPNRQLVADSLGVDLYVYDGRGKTLCLCGEVDQKEHSEKLQPIVIIGRGKTLRFVNVKIENGSLLRKYTYLGNGSSYSVFSQDGVDIELLENMVYQSNKNELHNNISLGGSSSSDVGNDSTIVSSFTFDAQAVSPEFTFYDSSKSCLADSSHGEKLLRAKLELSFMYAWRENDTWVRALVKDLNVEAGSGLVIIDPFDIVGGYTSVIDGSNLSLLLTDVCIHLPLSVISLVLNLQAQVTQAFQSGNPSPLAACTNFDRLWESPIDKGPGSSLTFWRPRAPPNYVILGDCVTSRMMPPSQAVMAVSNIYGRVRKPITFEFIGSLSAIQGYQADDDSLDCSLWLPIPPAGYHALGCVAHAGKLPPPCHIVYCLRSDLLASATASECVLCVPPNSIFASGFSLWRLDNAPGSCLARPSNDGPPRGFCYDLNSLILLKSDYFFSLEHCTSDFNVERGQCGGVHQGNDESNVARRVSNERRHCISTPSFERVWWDKGIDVQRRLSIWRPIPQPGYGIVGDCIMEGYEPPSVGTLFTDTFGISKKPLGFTKVAQFGPKISDVFLWYPIPPPGHVTLGYVVSRMGETPQNEIFCCPRKDLVHQASIFKVPILKSTRNSNCWSIWKVENKACTFLASSNLEMPSCELAFSIADGDFEKEKPRDNMTAELKLGCLSVTLMDSLCGMMSPLFDITTTNIKLATRGQTSSMNAVLIASIAASAFNMQLEDWEPLVEAFDAILKFETYVNPPSGYGKRVRLAASSILNINLSASNVDTFIQMILSWRKQTEIESKAAKINMESGKCYNKMDDSTLSAIDENDFQTVVIENRLGCDVYVKKEDHNSDEVELLQSDGCTVVWVPPPRFTKRLNVADEFREARRYVSVVIFESKGFSTADDGNGHNIFCALRLVLGGQSLDQQKMFLQSARTKCIKPSLTETGEAVVQWNELFIFEVPQEGEAKLEVKVTNLAAKAGKGEVIGAVCVPIRYNTKILKKVASSRMISLPSETRNIVPHTMRQDEVGDDKDNSQENGLVFISTTFFERNKLPTLNSTTVGSGSSYGDRGVGFSIGFGPRGSWESFGSLLPLSVTPKMLEGDFFAMEVSMKNGKKHVVLRGLATVMNDSDISLDVYIHHTSKIDHMLPLDSTFQNIIMEEIFENQWYQPDSGWSKTQTEFPGNWSNRDFSLSAKELFEPPLPFGWKWVSTWTVDKPSYVDMDGWAYGCDFQNMQWPPSRFTPNSANDTVRRRRWVNTRKKCGEGDLDYKDNVFSVGPGSSAILPWRTLIRDSEQCLQIRPHIDHPHVLYTWGSAVSLASSVKDQSLISRGLLAQGPIPRQSTSKRDIKAPFLFILDHIEKRDMLICSAPSDQRKKLWLSVCSDASVLHTGLNVPVYDWKISVNSPLKIDNRLPCEAEYMVWGRQAGTMIEMQQGVISSRECVHVYSVDVQRPIYLTLFVQGGWTMEKDPVLVLDLLSNNHVSSFRMIRQGDKRKLRVSIEHDLGGSIAGSKTVRLFVPYWISNDSSLSLGYRLVEVDPSTVEDLENPSFSRGDKSGRMSVKKTTNTLDRRFSLSRRNSQVLEVIEDEAPIPSMLSPPDYRAYNDIMMFSSSKNSPSLSPRIGISVAMRGSDIYSTGISLCDLENKEIVDLNAFQSDGFYHKLSASLTMTSDRTKVIHFKPQMLFLNRIGCSVCLQQCDTYSVKWIHPTDPPKCFGWTPSSKGELLRLRLDGFNWSYPFSLPTEGVMRLSLKKEDLSDEEYVRIVVRSGAKACHYEVIFRPNSFSSPYRIENVSMFLTMNFRQVGGPFNSWNPLPPNAAAPFFWEDLGRDRLLELLINGTDPSNSMKFNINEISDHYPIVMDGASGRALHVTIMTEDKINVVRISDLMPGDEHRVTVNKKFSSFEPRPSTFSGSSKTSESFTTSSCEFNLIVDLSELGLSLVDHTPEEILYLSIQNLQFSYLSSLDSGINRYKLRMGEIQVDNQLPLTPMPVLFKPQRTAENTDYILKLSAITQWNGSVDLCVYPYLGFHGPENSTFLINIHEPIIWRLHECIQHINFGRLNDSQMTAVSFDPIINIGVLSISEFRLKVSMAMSPSQRPRGVLGFWSSLMTALGNTENMHVKINPRFGENFCKRQSALITYAVSEIQKDLLSQPLQLLSGVDILGNASSALQHMSKGVAALSMDTKFIQSRQRQDSKGVEDFGDVIREGGGALAKGFFRGVTGILTKPIEGAKSSGVEGFVQGVGKGLIGAAAQPVSGVLDLLSKTTEGANAMRMKIASAITSEGQLIRRRLPRAIGGDNLLRPYDEYKSQGQVILQLAESGFFGQVDLFRVRGKFALSDAYEDHFLLPEGKILEITHRRVVLLQKPGISQNKFNASSDPCVVLWDVLWGDLVTMEMAYMKNDNQKAPPSCVILYSGAQSGELKDRIRVVKCSKDSNQAHEIYTSIHQALSTYGPNQSKEEERKKKKMMKPYSPVVDDNRGDMKEGNCVWNQPEMASPSFVGGG